VARKSADRVSYDTNLLNEAPGVARERDGRAKERRFTMTLYTKRAKSRNRQLDLFDWSDERELQRTSPAARRIAERFGVTLIHATTIARLAGIGPEATR
jgi:hypothetical protein